MSDEEWWAKWEKKMRKIRELEEELNVKKRDDDEITQEEYDWVERELEQVDKLYYNQKTNGKSNQTNSQVNWS